MVGEPLLYAPPEVIAAVMVVTNMLIGSSLSYWGAVKIDAWFKRREVNRHVTG